MLCLQLLLRIDEQINCFTVFPRAETVVEVGVLPDELGNLMTWTAKDFKAQEVFSWTWAMPRAHVAHSFGAIGLAGAMPARDAEFQYLWTGETWYAANALKHSYVIDREARLNVMTDCLGLFNFIGYAVMGAPEGLAKALATSKVLSKQEANGITTLRISRNDAESVQMDIMLDQARDAVSEVVLEAFQPLDGGGRERLMHIRFVVLDWMTVEGHEIPRRAVREARLFRHEVAGATPEKPVVQRIGFVRHSFRVLQPDEIDPAMFQPPPANHGDGVSDKRLKIGYAIGGTKIMVDGHIFQLRDPIEKVLEAEDLERIMATAEEITVGSKP